MLGLGIYLFGFVVTFIFAHLVDFHTDDDQPPLDLLSRLIFGLIWPLLLMRLGVIYFIDLMQRLTGFPPRF